MPIVSANAEMLGLVERIDALLDCEMEVRSGRIVLAIIPDAPAGRSPLFRLNEFYADKDIELLFGEPISLSKLSDDTLGRVLDKLRPAGTNKAFGTVMLGVMRIYDPDTSHAHHDITTCELFPRPSSL
ncbi:MAG: DUF4277 domain-containing protein [Pseudomonadota bacterium]